MTPPRADEMGSKMRRKVRAAKDIARNTHGIALGCAALMGAACFVAGCASNDKQRYVPPEIAAQQALEAALTHWQNGKAPPCLVKTGPPAIQLVDTHHSADRKLTAFTVLGATTGDADRCYAVRLTFDNPHEDVRARFVVLGLDPLWVLRYEDYEMLSHWDHPMPANSAPPKKKP